MTESNEIKAGKAFYSRKLGLTILNTGYLDRPWVAVEGAHGYLTWFSDEEVDVASLDRFVRGVHYESAMNAAERMVRLGLDKLDQEEVE